MRIAMCFAAFAALSAAGGPRLDLERFPDSPYVAPPTVVERAYPVSELAAARARHKGALTALALRIGAPTGMTAEAVSERAAAFDELSRAAAVNGGDTSAPLNTIGMIAAAAAAAGFAAGRRATARS